MNKAWYKGFLTKREYEVFRLNRDGVTQSEIAIKLGIKPPRVYQIQSSIEDKVRRAKETLDVVYGENVSPIKKRRDKDKVRVFGEIIKERVKKNVKYGENVVEIEPW